MMNRTRTALTRGAPLFATVALLFSFGILGTSCEKAGEAVDNFDSEAACDDYCAKKYDCQNRDPSENESTDCVNACRNSIDDNCGNEHQGQANDKIGECVDKSCAEFWACMSFSAAPECFGFVSQ